MPNSVIPREAARIELSRINSALDKPYILIGGLAVHQFIPTRNSNDIDLICDFATVQALLGTLYPLSDWNIVDETDNDYRPSYKITHRYENRGTISFGPKVLERGPYAFLDWTVLSEDAKPFRKGVDRLDRILVPSPHNLAYTKLISFIGRSEDKGDKITQDLKDLIGLTEYADFSLARFWDILRKNDLHGSIREQFRARAKNYGPLIQTSGLAAVSQFFAPSKPPEPASKATPQLSVYIAGPHTNIKRNGEVAAAVRSHGHIAKVPYEEVEAANLTNTNADATAIRQVCISAIDSCEIFAVDLEQYGLDTAWELGYAEGRGKTIVGFNLDPSLASASRHINRRIYSDNFMHDWARAPVFANADDIASTHKGQTVYVCGSFSNREIDRLGRTRLHTDCKLILPKDHINKKKSSLPSDYPLTDRDATNRLLRSADVVLVVLPRYGMDASWQIGYAMALGKTVAGLMRRDDGNRVTVQSFWEHWMHGWRQKIHVPTLADLLTTLRGFSSRRS